jgi:hypothetical protein
MIMQKNDRDCLTCCLAELLQIEYSDIPKFYEIYPQDLDKCNDTQDYEFRKQFDEWLDSKGYMRIMIDIEVKDGIIKMPYISRPFKCFGILKKEKRSYSHIVILTIHDREVLIDDPKQNSDYELKDIIGIEFILKKNQF